MKCYFLSWKHKGNVGYVAYTNIKAPLDHELIEIIADSSILYFDFTIKEVTETRKGLIVNDRFDTSANIWLDYIPNSLAWPLMSEKMKNLIDNNANKEDEISWISTNVSSGNEVRRYYILKFNKRPDVLDVEETLFVKGTDVIIKPVFSSSKILNLSIFTKSGYGNLWKITSSLFVSEKLKKAIQKEKLTGLEFSETRVK